MSAIYEQITKKPLEEHVHHLIFEICVEDANEEDVEVPYVVYKLPGRK